MKSEDLLRAIGELEEERLERSEITAHRPPRILWKVALVAALVSCLAVTAVAAVAEVIRGRAQVTEQTVYQAEEEGREPYTMDSLEIFVDWDMESDAPFVIQHFYVPTALDAESLEGFNYGFNEDGQTDIYIFELHWSCGSTGEYIEYFQKAGASHNPDNPVDIRMGVPEDMEISSETIVLGEKAYFLVKTEEWIPQNRLYWTDGYYIFCLACPDTMPMDEVQQILESMTEVADFSAYKDAVCASLEANNLKKWEAFQEEMTSDEPYVLKTQVENGWLKEGQNTDSVGVCAEFAIEEDAPEVIERIVVPRYFDNGAFYGRSWSEKDGRYLSHTVYWETPEYGEGERVKFTQECESFRYRQGNEIDAFFDVKEGFAVTSGIVVLGEHRLFEVSYEEDKLDSPGQRCFYWTDGRYIFHLCCPYGMDDSDILDILDILNSIR